MEIFGRIASRDGARMVRARTGTPGERRASALGWVEAGLVRALLIVLIALVALASASFEPVRPARAQTQEESSETLTQLMQRLSSEGMAELRHLTTFYSPRQPYSPEELAAAEYIEGKLKALGGYTVTVQPFRRRGEENEVSELSLVGSRARDVRSQAMEGSAVGDVTAPVVAVGKALAGDVPDSGLDGKVAIIERGSISFAEQVSRVAGAGAVAAIIYNSQDRVFRNEQPFSGSLIEGDNSGSTIPVATIWREEGTSLLDTLKEGTEVRVRLKVTYRRWLTSRNIIAEKVGTDSTAGVVVVGAHYDTLRSAQGASDNGTGVASLLVMAEEISGLQLSHTVRFIFFGAEEWGLHGSDFYVEEYSAYEEGAIIAMINLTSLGSGRPAVSSIGSRVLTDWVTGTFASQNSLDVRYWNPPGGSCFSDHCFFSRTLSVPTISFHGDDLSVSNSYDDVIDLIDPSIMGTQMAVALELIRQAPDIVPQPPAPEPKPPAPPIPPFAAQFLVLPERHDGEKDFFFWLFFNQQPDELGRRTVWDGLLHIAGADIAVVRLLTPYTFWIVTVEPTQRGDITIRLPRRECTEVGSVCADGRPLSKGLSETVPGPDSRVTSNRNSPATGSPAIEGSPVVGQALTATSTGIADEDGMMGAVFAYQWLADDAEIADAIDSSYALSASVQGKTIRVRLSFTDDAGNEESVTSAATEAVTVANSPASGAPSISGTAQVSETLTVDTSGIADADGLTNASFAYRWLADDVEIAGATASTYTLTSSEQGKTIRVRLSFTDDAGNEESVTSAATEAVTVANSPASGAPSISGTAQVSETLTVDTSGIADADGLTNASFAYRWLADDVEIAGATASTYTLTSSEQGKTIKVRLSFTDDAGNEESVTSAATEAVTVANSPASGAPSISGTAQVSETLTVDTSGIADADGLTNASFAYRWLADDAEIAGATASTYTLTSSEQGKTIKVRLSFTDDAGNEESVTSATTGLVAAAPSPLTATVQDTPGSHDGQNAFTFELRFSETPKDNFSYRTLRDHAFTVTGGEVVNAQRVNPPSNVGWRITVHPSGDHDVTVSLPATTDCAHWGAVCTVDNRKLSSATELTVPGPVEQQVVNSPATGAPTIRGTVQVGETLTADTSGIADADGLTSATFTYGWLADDVEIAGATGSTYTLAADDEGKAIKVRVTFTDDAGNEESLTSAPTAAVTQPLLTAAIHDAPESHDGQSVFTFELRFSETPKDNFSYRTLRDHAFTVTGGEVVRARRLERGKNVRWEITVQPSGNAGVTIALLATTDCAADGAVCTEDGRMFSGGVELTVSGPGG